MNILYLPLKLIEEKNLHPFRYSSTKSDAFIKLQNSIKNDGLLNPILVAKTDHGLEVQDGKKRVKVIQALSKSENLKRRYTKIPCVVQTKGSRKSFQAIKRPMLLSDQDLAHNVLQASRGSSSMADIAKRYECDMSIAIQCLNIESLHREIQMLFKKNAISLEQASALSSLSDKNEQLETLKKVGPFAMKSDIQEAIKALTAKTQEQKNKNIIRLFETQLRQKNLLAA